MIFSYHFLPISMLEEPKNLRFFEKIQYFLKLSNRLQYYQKAGVMRLNRMLYHGNQYSPYVFSHPENP